VRNLPRLWPRHRRRPGAGDPDDRKTLRSAPSRPCRRRPGKECQDDLLKYAGDAGIPRDTPWSQLSAAQHDWVMNGSPNWNGNWNKQWYGVNRFFEYLESKAYKMHIRVLLSKYRSYTPCPTCGGARLKLEALLWRLGSKEQADAVLPPGLRFLPRGADWSRAQLEALAGPAPARPDAAADRAAARLLRRPAAAQHDAGRRAEAAARRDPHAAALPGATSASAT
jgi:hypothetical protein